MNTGQDYYGHVGSILYIDLTSRSIWKKPLSLDLARKFIGGQGVGLNILYEMLKPKVDPLSPENVMVFGTGPLLGTIMVGSGKCYLNTKYAIPASRDKKKYFISTSMFGSNRFGPMMKNAGYDHIVITGRSEKPCYVKVIDDDVEICDAGDIWGKDTYATGAILRQRYRGKTGNCGTWVIGRAGENLVSFALGFADDWHNAGRYAGAVAGSKNLKAVVTLGTKGIKVANSKKFKELVNRKRNEIMCQPGYERFMSFGRGVMGRLLQDTLVEFKGCNGGMCACKSIHDVKDGIYKGSRSGGVYPSFPAYAQMALGIQGYPENYGIGFRFVELVNRYGLCVNTAINMLRFVTALYQRGIVTKDDMGGLELKIGDFDFYTALLEKIVSRKDIGATMAEGWYPLNEKFGVDASNDWEAGSPITKGIDLLVDARIWPSLLRSDPVGFSPPFGLSPIVHAKAKHTHSATCFSKKVVSWDDVKEDTKRMGMTEDELREILTDNSFNISKLARYGEDAEAVYNALGICDCCLHGEGGVNRDMPWLAEVYSAVTGFEISPRELLRAGERLWTLEKMLNVRDGFDRMDDQVPPLYIKNIQTPLMAREGDRYLSDWFGKRLSKEDIEQILDEYYEDRGWDVRDGLPTKTKLAELGLDYLFEIVNAGDC